MSASLSALAPELQPFARDLVTAAGDARLMPQVTSTLRSHQDQVRLYRRAQSGLSPYPAARPGTSAHEYGWAFDMVVSPLSALADVGWLWESWGGVWGGHPTRPGSGYDPVHFEYPGWRELVDWSSPDLRQQQDTRGKSYYTDLANKVLAGVISPVTLLPSELEKVARELAVLYAPAELASLASEEVLSLLGLR